MKIVRLNKLDSEIVPDFWRQVSSVEPRRDGGEDPSHLPLWIGYQNYPALFPDWVEMNVSPATGTLVAVNRGRAVGMATLAWGDRSAATVFPRHGYTPNIYLGGVIVFAKYRGLGYAHRLLNGVEQLLNQNQLSCGLFCRTELAKLYERHGFSRLSFEVEEDEVAMLRAARTKVIAH